MLRWGVIGAGGFASKKPIPGLVKANKCSLEAICDVSDVADVANRFGVSKVYRNLKDLLADRHIDAVYICTPVYLHAEQTILAAQAGKHILVEKPIARTLDEAQRMVAACKAARVKLQVGYMRRFHPYHKRIKEIIDSGTLGRIVEARIQTHLWYPEAKGAWRQDPAKGIGGAFADMGSHCLELLEFFLGPVVATQGYMDNITFGYPVEDMAVVVVKFESGAVGIIDSSFAISYRNNTLELYGEKGTLIAQRTAGPFTDPELKLMNDEGTTEIKVEIDGDQYQKEFEHFATAVEENREPDVNGVVGLRNLEQILAIYESARVEKHA